MLLLTRPIDDSIKSKDVLAALGFEVMIEPMLEVVYHPVAIIKIREYDLVVATSRHGIAGLASSTTMRDIRIVTVGDSSKKYAIDLGFRSVEAAGGTVFDLLQHLKEVACGKRVLYVRGAHVSYDLRKSAEQLDVSLEELVLYSTSASVDFSLVCRNALALGRISGVLFYSPRTAEIFLELAAKSLQLECLHCTVAYTMSSRAAQVLGTCKWKGIFVSEYPTEASLFELVQHKAR